MAKNLVNGTNIVIEESGDNISMDLSSSYNTNLQQEINDSFKENNIYSTDETIIGTWMNKPLYRKVINANMKCNGALTHGIVNLDLITDLKIIFKQTNDNFVILPKNTVDKEYTIGVDKCTSSIIQLSCGSYFANNQNYDFTFILEYIKTTY